MRLGEDLSEAEMDKVLAEQGRVQDAIEAAGAWDLESRLEIAEHGFWPSECGKSSRAPSFKPRSARSRSLPRSVSPLFQSTQRALRTSSPKETRHSTSRRRKAGIVSAPSDGC